MHGTHPNRAANSALPETMTANAPAVAKSSVSTPGTASATNYAAELLHLRSWEKRNLIVFVAAPDAARNASVAQGLALWNPHLGDRLSLQFTQNPAEADIRVSFADHGSLPGGAIGRTEVMFRNTDNVIVGAAVRLDRTLPAELLTQVAAHEFGHALGMDGHSADKSDLMYTHAHLPAQVTERDQNTLRIKYAPFAPASAPRVAAKGSVIKGSVITAAACCLSAEDVSR